MDGADGVSRARRLSGGPGGRLGTDTKNTKNRARRRVLNYVFNAIVRRYTVHTVRNVLPEEEEGRGREARKVRIRY